MKGGGHLLAPYSFPAPFITHSSLSLAAAAVTSHVLRLQVLFPLRTTRWGPEGNAAAAGAGTWGGGASGATPSHGAQPGGERLWRFRC